MNLAHALTFLRILLSPCFALFYLGYEWMGLSFSVVPYIMLGMLAVSEGSDFLDGIIARHQNQVTDLGKVLDPIADSLTHITLFLSFTQGVVGVPLLLVLFLLYRDFFMSILRILCALKGVALAARMSGKIKTGVQGLVVLGILLVLIGYGEGSVSLSFVQQVSFWGVLIAVLGTFFSLVDYLIANRSLLRQLV